jgi:hypothetical protein
MIVSSDNHPIRSRRKQEVSKSRYPRQVLSHLQDCFKSGPTWRVHELRAERGVFGGCDAAEEGEFVLFGGRVEWLALRTFMVVGSERRGETYLAENVEASDVGKEVEVGDCNDALCLVKSNAI